MVPAMEKVLVVDPVLAAYFSMIAVFMAFVAGYMLGRYGD
jgi:hypothetical protein